MKLSVVTTLFHSESYVQEFYRRMVASIKKVTDEYELIFVNDGSPDRSLEAVLDIQHYDRNVIAIDLSRNFGHHRALMTGLKHARGDYVFMTDSDLEESPELLELYWNELQNNKAVDVVYGVQRTRKGGMIEKVSGRLWYLIFSYLSDVAYPADTLTARLMSKRYVENVIKFNEKELELWGIFALTGFDQQPLIVTKGSRGSSTYTWGKKVGMIIDSITSFSSKPLIWIFLLGLIVSSVSFLFIVYLLFRKIVYQETLAGWTSTLVSIWFLGGILIFCIGIIGIYLSKMFLEIKNRPLTTIRNIYKSS